MNHSNAPHTPTTAFSVMSNPATEFSLPPPFNPSTPKHKHAPPQLKPLSFLEFINREISSDGQVKLHHLNKTRIRAMLSIPAALEPLFLFGFFLCFDSFLFVFAFLPIRAFHAILGILAYPFTQKWTLSHTQASDLLRMLIISFSCLILYFVDVSLIYHYIRGQSFMKLYVAFNMIQVLEKLCSSFGLDILDALFGDSTVLTSDKGLSSWRHLIVDFSIALIYVVCHSLVNILNVMIINSAINSSSLLLYSIIVSNNFVELKATVFKRFAKENLFQILCSDIVERFHLFLILFVILVQSVSVHDWQFTTGWLSDALWAATAIFGVEMMVDWIKHSFIIKFNRHSPTLYNKYMNILCLDLTTCRQSNVVLDYSHAVVRRLGFLTLPLACMLIRIFQHSFVHNPTTLSFKIAFFVLVFFCCVVAKLLLTTVLLGYSCKRLQNRADVEVDVYPNRYTLSGNRVP